MSTPSDHAATPASPYPWLPERIRLRRRRAKLSQAELARRIGVAQASVSNWESGATTPELPTLWRLCAALGCREGDLLHQPTASRKSDPEKNQ